MAVIPHDNPMHIATNLMQSNRPTVRRIGFVLGLVYITALGAMAYFSIKLLLALSK